MLYTLSTQPFLDHFNKCYKNIITIDREPHGPLKNIVRRILPPKLSVFSYDNSCCRSKTCVYALTSFHDTSKLLCLEELDELFVFLSNNGYPIDNKLTKLINFNVKSSNSFICFISYNKQN